LLPSVIRWLIILIRRSLLRASLKGADTLGRLFSPVACDGGGDFGNPWSDRPLAGGNRPSTGATHYRSVAAFMPFALVPLYWLLSSVTPTKLLYSEGIRMWPSGDDLGNYGFVLTRSDFPRFFMNSVIVAGSTAFIVTVVAAIAGYAFSRFAFRGKMIIIALMLITQMFPLVMLIAPIFKMLSPLGLTNSLTGLVIVYSAFNVPFATVLMQSFFDGVPKDLKKRR
jgi:multiple sugar transport system permease protein